MTWALTMAALTIAAVVVSGPALWPPRRLLRLGLVDTFGSIEPGDVIHSSRDGWLIVQRRHRHLLVLVTARWYESAWWHLLGYRATRQVGRLG